MFSTNFFGILTTATKLIYFNRLPPPESPHVNLFLIQNLEMGEIQRGQKLINFVTGAQCCPRYFRKESEVINSEIFEQIFS